MILTTYIKNWIRYIIMTILVIPFGIILLNNFLPIYNDGPDFDGFYETRDTLLIIQSTDPDSLLLNTESTITIKSPEKEKTLQITNGYTSQPIKVESGLQIIFASKTGLNNTYTYILTPNGTIASLTAQSIINLNIKEPKLEIIQGNIKIYTGYNENNGNVSSIIMDYNKDRNNYLIQQIGGEAILNSTFDKFIRGYLNIVNSIFSITSYLPIEINLSYQQNILNYQEFHKYLPYQTNTNLGSTVADNEMIINQANEGINNTKAKQRFNSTKKFFNSFNK